MSNPTRLQRRTAEAELNGIPRARVRWNLGFARGHVLLRARHKESGGKRAALQTLARNSGRPLGRASVWSEVSSAPLSSALTAIQTRLIGESRSLSPSLTSVGYFSVTPIRFIALATASDA